jgi:hypothetical protein
MSNDLRQLNICKLTPEEVEKALADRFGDKLLPIDRAKLAKKRQHQERYRNGGNEIKY